MLSEKILADLTRPGPLLHALVAAAWPNICTESRLQVIDAVQGSGISRSTPDWLVDLAQADSSEIVRYWATRGAYFREQGSFDLSRRSESGGFERLPADPADLKRAERARSDSSELVRLSVDRLGLLSSGKVMTAMPQRQRLIAIRNQEQPSLPSFVEWLGEALEAGISDDDLAECAEEFFANPDMVRQLKEDDFEDGYAAHMEGKAVSDGWQLLKEKAGRRLTLRLAFVLPTKRGLKTFMASDFVGMPVPVLDALISRRGEDRTCRELADMVRSEPDRFPAEVVKSLNRDDEDYFSMPDANERSEYAMRHAVDRQAATIDAVLDIRGEMRKLQQRLDEIHEVASRKRGIFG